MLEDTSIEGILIKGVYVRGISIEGISKKDVLVTTSTEDGSWTWC